MRAAQIIGAGLFLTLPAVSALLGASRDTSRRGQPKKTETIHTNQIGIASYYAGRYHGQTTASGEVFDMHQLTAAHRTLPFGTRVKVTRAASQHSVIVRINDRGPFIAGRVIDVSLAAARELQFVEAGLAEVRLEVVQ